MANTSSILRKCIPPFLMALAPGLIVILLIAAGQRNLQALAMAATGLVACLVGFSVLGRGSGRSQEQTDELVMQLEQMETFLKRQCTEMEKMSSMLMLTDQAKRMIYHENEMEAIREAVNVQLLHQNPAGALALVDQIETQMGLKAEAAEIRNEIERFQRATIDEQIDGAIARIQGLVDNRNWPRAQREARRLATIFPDNAKIKTLPNRIKSEWNSHKGHLLKSYGEAFKVNDVERSIELLRELDKYLTAEEAAALRDSAKDVFKKKLHNFGVQFAIAVAEQDWQQAINTGREIMKEFPNTRMAREVREKIPLLKRYLEIVQNGGEPPVEV